jgi:hypothetical protein
LRWKKGNAPCARLVTNRKTASIVANTLAETRNLAASAKAVCRLASNAPRVAESRNNAMSFHNSAHAPILNRLAEMQRSSYFATARPDLEKAEQTIVDLETENARLKKIAQEWEAAAAEMNAQNEQLRAFAPSIVREPLVRPASQF